MWLGATSCYAMRLCSWLRAGTYLVALQPQFFDTVLIALDSIKLVSMYLYYLVLNLVNIVAPDTSPI